VLFFLISCHVKEKRITIIPSLNKFFWLSIKVAKAMGCGFPILFIAIGIKDSQSPKTPEPSIDNPYRF